MRAFLNSHRRSALPAVLLVTIVLVGVAASIAPAARARTMSVEVREGRVRTTPSFFGATAGTLAYADRVEVLEEKGAWFRVRSAAKGLEGWVHRTVLTKQKIVLKAGKKDAEIAASSDEVALAGKGFNSQVEANYRSTHTNIDYTWVDTMETFIVSPAQMEAFLKQGALEPAKEGTP